MKYNTDYMDIEWEAKFLNVDKDKLRKKLQKLGAKLTKSVQLYKRAVFFLPKGNEVKGGWLRVRDEADKVTMSLKVVTNGKVEMQKEVMVVVDDYDNARKLLSEIGCVEKAYQETKREVWQFKDVEITIDEWPYLEPYAEVEGNSEEAIKNASLLLGFDYSQAVFGSADQVISKKYGISEDAINNEIPRITFAGKNPYLNWKVKNKI